MKHKAKQVTELKEINGSVHLEYTVIKNEVQYSTYLERVCELMNNCDPNTPEGDELELLGLLINDYDNRVHPIPELNRWDRLMFWLKIYKK